jgi:hypothetical protein
LFTRRVDRIRARSHPVRRDRLCFRRPRQ